MRFSIDTNFKFKQKKKNDTIERNYNGKILTHVELH